MGSIKITERYKYVCFQDVSLHYFIISAYSKSVLISLYLKLNNYFRHLLIGCFLSLCVVFHTKLADQPYSHLKCLKVVCCVQPLKVEHKSTNDNFHFMKLDLQNTFSNTAITLTHLEFLAHDCLGSVLWLLLNSQTCVKVSCHLQCDQN